MSFEQQLNAYIDAANRALDALIDNPLHSRVAEAMEYSLLSDGKRIRAVITLATADMLGTADKNTTSLACAIECIHTYSLVHDDLPCMDNDDMRRGKPSCHKAFDEATALLAGDGLLTLGFEAAGYLQDAEMSRRALNILASAAGYKGMIYGQELDLLSADSTVESILNTHKYKCGCLFRAAALLGAASVNADAYEADRFASRIGLVFQLVDDIIDIDEPDGSHNLARVLGVERAREMAFELTEQAKRELTAAYFERARFLCELADMLLERVS